MKIVLFDVDGVLIEPHGYHMALQEVVRKCGSLCAVPECTISDETITAFEASGISSEWDSSAICYLSILKLIWQSDPYFIPPDREGPTRQRIAIQPPDFSVLPLKMAASSLSGLPALERAERMLLSDEDVLPEHRQYIQYYIRSARSIATLTHQLFQELIAGSAAFEQIYHLAPVYRTESYLKLYDKSKLNEQQSARIMAWARQPDHAAALFTARPGYAPPPSLFTPDVEIGAELLGLDGITPASEGKLAWVARQLGLDEQALVKPSPAHSLMALLLAVGLLLEEVPSAVQSFLDGEKPSAGLLELQGADVSVLEDSIGGILSLQSACRGLAEMGIQLHPHYLGTSIHPEKAASLTSAGATVYGRMDDALNVLLM
jgi:hypothetical protein